MGWSRDVLISTLAELLVGKQVDTDTIQQALQFLCTHFAFDGGAVYEIDQVNLFHLKEHLLQVDKALPPTLDLSSMSPQLYRLLCRTTLLYLHPRADLDPQLLRLPSCFGAAALVVLPLLDGDAQLQGFVLLWSLTDDAPLAATDTGVLSILLSMLSLYLGSRIYQNKLSFAQASLGSILDNAGVDIYVNDFYTHEVLYVNQSMAAPYGGPEKFWGKTCWEVIFAGQTGPCDFCPQKQLIDEEGNPTKVYTWDYQRVMDGCWFRVFSSAFRWTDGRLAHMVSSADITANKQSQALVEYMANYDSLTRLPNRRKLVHDCEAHIHAAVQNEVGYLLFFDIDGFKAINDTLGHDAGDELLEQLGAFLPTLPHLGENCYRNGGDEFVAMVGGVGMTKADIRAMVAMIHQRFAQPWVLKRGVVQCNTSVGVACFPEDGQDAESLLRVADQAMYQVKKAGGGGICFGQQLQSEPLAAASEPSVF